MEVTKRGMLPSLNAAYHYIAVVRCGKDGAVQSRAVWRLAARKLGQRLDWNPGGRGGRWGTSTYGPYFGLVYVLFSMTVPVVCTPVEAHSKSTSAGLLFGMILCDDVFCTGPIGFIRSG